ncbi:hypothetical protein ACHAXT_013260 [Thalassiosira profunda]
MPPPSTPPGVRVDKQASLLLAPSCSYREEYLEEDVQTLLSDLMHNSADDSDEASAAAVPARNDTRRGSADRNAKAQSPTTKETPKGKGKQRFRRLQWRPPGMAKARKKQQTKSHNSGSPPKGAPRLPPSSSTRKHKPRPPSNHAVIRPSVPSSGASVTTFRSSASTILTTKSSSTQKRSNRAGAKKPPYSLRPAASPASVATSAASVKSGTPPLARYRRRRKMALELAKRKELEKVDEHKESVPPQSPPSAIRKEAFQGASLLETSAITEDGNSLVESDTKNDTSDEQSQITFGNTKIRVTRNYTTPTRASDICAPHDEAGGLCGANSFEEAQDQARQLFDTTYATGAALADDLGMKGASACLDGNPGSPTSVMGLDDCGSTSIPFDEYSHYQNMNAVTDGVKRLTTAAEEGSGNLLDGDATDEDTVATIDRRKPGPIDMDTCAAHLTPSERRNLRAMHNLGYAHLRQNELPQAMGVFAEILRGQKERHGKTSLQTATAMHNLGVVCFRSGRHTDTVRLCDGAARIRVEKLGKDSPEVAASLSQQGVALMEMKEYTVALASFREALRIRRKALKTNGDGDGGERQLIVRLLNNIGCAHFEQDQLGRARVAFEEALWMQRELMKKSKRKGAGVESVNPKDAFHAPLSIALTLTNLGSIHLRLEDYETSLVHFEEAALIQESVLGDDHKVVASTQESIAFVKSKEEQDERAASRGGSVKIDRVLSAMMGAVSSKRCTQPATCAPEDYDGLL